MFKFLSLIFIALLCTLNVRAQSTSIDVYVDSLSYMNDPIVVDSTVSYYYFEAQYPYTIHVHSKYPDIDMYATTMSLSIRDKVLYIDVYNYMLTSDYAGDVYKVSYKVINK